MKYGQSMTDNMVPEWQEQYLDYYGGKKLIKKLKKRTAALKSARSSLSSGAATNSATPQTPMPTVKSTPIPRPQASTGSLDKLTAPSPAALTSSRRPGLAPILRTPGASPVTRYVSRHESPNTTPAMSSHLPATDNSAPSGGTLRRKVTFPDDNFALPSPAINPDFGDSGAKRDSVTSSKDSVTEDTRKRSAGTDVEEELPHDRTPLLSYGDDSTSNLRLKRRSTMGKLFDNLRKRNSFAQLFNAPTNTTYTSAQELDDYSAHIQQDFLHWVDGQLNKVCTFYREKEDESLNRFLVLQDQLVQFDVQKTETMGSIELAKQQAKTAPTPTRRKNALRRATILAQRAMNIPDHNGHISDDDDDDDDDLDQIYDVNGLHVLHETSTTDEGVSTSRFVLVDSAERELRMVNYWIRKQLIIFSKFDMPSLPTWDWMREDGKAEKQYYEEGYYSDSDEEEESKGGTDHDAAATGADPGANRRDYVRRRKKLKRKKIIPSTPGVTKKRTVPYFIARRMLKRALYEFYRSLMLLKSYRLENRTAFRKVVKKYDKSCEDELLGKYMKKVDEQYFVTSDILDNLQVKIEGLFTQYFENGNRKIAVSKLREAANSEDIYYWPTYLDGLVLGMAIPMGVFTIYLAIHRVLNGSMPEGKWLMQIWAGFLLLCLMGICFGFNCAVWTHFKVNYKLIFEFDPRRNLDFRQYMMFPSFLLLVCAILAWFSFHDFFPGVFSGRDFPWLYLAFGAFVFLMPFDIFYLEARTWFLFTILRLFLSGLYPVEFRDFFMGDIFCSLTYSFSNLSMFFCLYHNHWSGCLDGTGNTNCGSSKSRVLGFLSALPNIWRFLQCLRRFADTGDGFPHLLNMGKYFLACMYQMSLSLYRIEKINTNKILLIVFGALNAEVSAAWDLFMDWSLLEFGSKHFMLRDELTYPDHWVYYSAMVVDIILRNQWIAYVIPTDIQQTATVSFGVALAELIRRFIWMFFRMENEHATNVHLFRASRDAPLPYPTVRRHPHEYLPPTPITPSDEEARIGLGYPSEEEAGARSKWSSISKVLKMAHIKDFQRKKPLDGNKIRMAQEGLSEAEESVASPPDIIPEETEPDDDTS